MKRGNSWVTRGWSLAARIGYYTGPRTETGCRAWLGARDLDGYALVKSSGRMLRVSRVLLGLDIGDPLVAMHSCDHPPCVEPSHLSVGTNVDNMRDMASRGRSLAGERNPKAKLSRDEVEQIRWHREEGAPASALAKHFGVTTSLVSQICRGEIWPEETGA